MTEKEVLERIRNPDSWDEDLFQLYDQMEPNLSNLEPDTYRDFCTAYATWKQKVLELKRQEFDGYVGKANDLAPAELRDLWDKQLQSRPFDLIHLETNEETGKVIQCVRNFEIVLEEDSRFSDKIRYNEFSGETFLVGSTPWEQGSVCRAWTPTDDSQAFSLIQIDYGLRNRNDFFDALRNISAKHRFHPVREMLESLRWDGQEHIQQLLPDYLGAACTSYNYEVLRLWMLGGVARVFQPGTKVDNCLILTGRQGCGKSTFLTRMALDDEWFCDSLDSLDGSAAVQTIQGSWICELAELKSLARTSGGVDSIKRFLSATSDKLRLPYERRASIIPRQTIFAGTTNRTDFLTDETGNRRFLIVPVGIQTPTKDLFNPNCMEDFRGAWAEAVHLWKTQKPKLILPESCLPEAERLRSGAMVDDGARGMIQAYLEDKDRVCSLEIWTECLGESGRPPRWKTSEINEIVSNVSGWKKMENPARFGKYGHQRGFERCKQTSIDQRESCKQPGMVFVPVPTDEEVIFT